MEENIYNDVEGIEHHLSWNAIDRIGDLVQFLKRMKAGYWHYEKYRKKMKYKNKKKACSKWRKIFLHFFSNMTKQRDIRLPRFRLIYSCVTHTYLQKSRLRRYAQRFSIEEKSECSQSSLKGAIKSETCTIMVKTGSIKVQTPALKGFWYFMIEFYHEQGYSCFL